MGHEIKDELGYNRINIFDVFITSIGFANI